MEACENKPCPSIEQGRGQEMRLLCGRLSAHVAERSRSAEGDGRNDDIEFACATLISGPAELGTEMAPSLLHEQLRARLAGIRPESLPEAKLCRLWLMASTRNAPTDSAPEIAVLAALPLWDPVQSLAFRALAHAGRQDLLEQLLSVAAPPSLVRDDAMLETGLTCKDPTSPVACGASPVSAVPELAAPWQAVLAAEKALAVGAQTDQVEGALREAMRLPDPGEPIEYIALEKQRLAARAAAAMVRLRLARCQDDGGILSEPTSVHLPNWERAFLKALSRWVAGDLSGAQSLLKQAAEMNVHKSCVRLALASLLASSDPSEALSQLQSGTVTREVLVARAALLIRMQRHDEAWFNIDQARSGSEHSEPLRYSWPTARKRLRWQELAIRAGLAEHRSDWKEAQAAWREACTVYPRKSLDMARQWFAAQRERRSLGASERWRQDELTRRIQRAEHEIGQIPLKESDAFFRGLANVDCNTNLAAKDLASLLHRRTWLAAEARAGGSRLVALGDGLTRLGKPAEAIQAYQAAPPHVADAAQRLAIARVWARVEQGATGSEIAAAVHEAVTAVPGSACLQLIAALGLLMAGQQVEARRHLEAAASLDAPPPICRALLTLIDSSAGRPAEISKKDFAGLNLSAKTQSALRLVVGGATASERLCTLLEQFDTQWSGTFLVDPQPIAQAALAELCNAGEWDQAQALAVRLQKTGQNWAVTLGQLVAIRRSLQRAIKHAEQAPEALADLQSVQPPPGVDTPGHAPIRR